MSSSQEYQEMLLPQVQKMWADKKVITRYERFEAQKVKKFSDKFFFMQDARTLPKSVRMLMRYLSEIHSNFSDQRFIVWFGEAPENSLGITLERKFIAINKHSEFYLITLAHEIAHIVDGYEVQLAATNEKLLSAYNHLINEIEKSNLATEIKELLESNNIEQSERNFFQYYSLKHELFARSYVFYLYNKLGQHIKDVFKKSFVPTEYSILAADFSLLYTELSTEENDALDVKVHWDTEDRPKEMIRAWDKFLKQKITSSRKRSI